MENELTRIAKDVRSGALPREEISSFISWAFRKIFWICIAIIGVGVVLFWLAG